MSLAAEFVAPLDEAAYQVTARSKKLRKAIEDYADAEGLDFDGEVLRGNPSKVLMLGKRLRQIGGKFRLKRIAESVEHRDDGYYVHTPGGRTLGPFDSRTGAGMEDMFWLNGADAGDEDELFGEADGPGDGEEPADSKLARTLANTFLKKKAALALPFRQLWRHKYIKKNYDPAQAWKLFYWEMTHSGAGGKGYNPATRKAAAKLVTNAFSRWAKAGMKAKVKRADGAVEKPVGEISRPEFVRWFMSSAPSVSEGRLHEQLVGQEYGRRPPMVEPKMPEDDPTLDLRLRIARAQGWTFKTGQSIKFRFMHNDERALNAGGRFQQDIEPTGYYMTTAPDDRTIESLRKAGKKYTVGTASFRNPLVLDWGSAYDQSSWKYRLSQHYDAKKRGLTKALLRDGYDGIVTVRQGVTSEIVALKGKPKMVESLRRLFVEQEDDEPPKKPPVKKKTPPPEPEEEPEMSDLEKEEEKAEKLGYELKDVQAYYDMQIATGLDQGTALVKTKRKFKVRRLKVSPTGKIMAPDIPDPEKQRKKQASQAPPPPPEEPVAGGGGGGGSATGAPFPEGPRGSSTPTGPQAPPGPSGEE